MSDVTAINNRWPVRDLRPVANPSGGHTGHRGCCVGPRLCRGRHRCAAPGLYEQQRRNHGRFWAGRRGADRPGRLTDSYSTSKAEAETLVLAAAREGLAAMMVNPVSLYGPSPLGPFSYNGLFLAATRGEVETVVDASVGWVLAEDAAAGHLLALERGEPGRRYVLCGEVATFGRMLCTFAGLVGGTQVHTVAPGSSPGADAGTFARRSEVFGSRSLQTPVPATPAEVAGTDPAAEAGELGKSERSDGTNRVGLRTLGALARLEGNALVLLEGLEAVRLDGGVVHEDVRTLVIGRDEAEALFGVEPFDGALRHSCFSHT
jgi:NAD dependent epimerase/dehydratase family